ncbi:hypothetical protein O3M35_009242 [Rhynocoris fuscipes]|uniref:Uncharacterized protein n=1 Tax=Rhynocoris fuscipes TaxID=488301 RepID=A0AAW1D254_9HEMI
MCITLTLTTLATTLYMKRQWLTTKMSNFLTHLSNLKKLIVYKFKPSDDPEELTASLSFIKCDLFQKKLIDSKSKIQEI